MQKANSWKYKVLLREQLWVQFTIQGLLVLGSREFITRTALQEKHLRWENACHSLQL